jgi:serpin B
VSGGSSVVLVALLVIGLVSFKGNSHSPPSASGAIQTVVGPDGSTHLVANVKTNALVGTRQTEATVALAEERFALRLTRLELAENAGSNVLLSPLSAHLDLSMLELGSAGATAREVAAALQSSGLSPAAQAAAWNGLVQSILAGESASEVHVANSVWVQQGLHLEPGFLRQAAETFGNDTYQVDFAASSAAGAINAWVAQQTAGRIKKLYGPTDLSAATEVVLANALHFHAAWQQDLFSDALVNKAPFYPAAGASVAVPTIAAQSEVPFDQAPAYNAVQLPYTNGRFAALLIEPTTGSMGTFLSALDAARLSSIVGSLASGEINLSMPELNVSSLGSLDRPLSSMGMAQAFDSADFSPMLGAAGAINQEVGGVKQAVTLDVNQWGTDAAAATGVSAVGTAARVVSATIAFNHPYLFLIRDVKTGTILFSSVVDNPATT